jgi:hypothetical protein
MGGLDTQEPPAGQILRYDTQAKRKLQRCVFIENTRIKKLNKDPAMYKVQKVTENIEIVFQTLQKSKLLSGDQPHQSLLKN